MGLNARVSLGLILISFPLGCKTNDSSTLATGESCPAAPSSSSCGYYSCAEEIQKCGEDGYLVAYGKKYCEKFTGLCDGELTSIEARKWIQGTTICLQRKASLAKSLACQPFEAQAFSDHPFCYTEGAREVAGVSFCQLRASEWSVIRSCVAAKDRRSRDGLRQIARVGFACAAKFRPGFFLESQKGEVPPDYLAALSDEEKEKRAKEFEAFAQETMSLVDEY